MENFNPLLAEIIKSEEINRSYLFEYNYEGSFNKDLNKFISSLLNVENDMDRFLKHPDLLYLQEDQYDPSYILDIVDFIDKKIQLSTLKIVVICNIERMSFASQTKLLKFIEDSREDCCFILTVERVDSVLNTIRSRCINVSFNKPSYESFSSYLNSYDLNNEKYNIYYKIFGGSFYGDCIKEVEEVRSYFFSVISGFNNVNYMYNLLRPSISDSLSFKDYVKKFPIRFLIDIIKSFYLDKLYTLSGNDFVFYNEDYNDKIFDLNLTISKLNKYLSYIKNYNYRLDNNYNYMWLRSAFFDY
jgi:hypothetical protein